MISKPLTQAEIERAKNCTEENHCRGMGYEIKTFDKKEMLNLISPTFVIGMFASILLVYTISQLRKSRMVDN